MRRRAFVSFLVVVAGLVVAAPSASATDPTPPIVTLQPDIAVVAEPNGLTHFEAEADGSPAPTVRWQYATGRRGPWTDIPGETGTFLLVPASEQPGSIYALGNAFRAVFTNPAGSAISRPAKLVWRAQWMRDLGSDIANVPLTELTIPGSHDMGTYGISGSSADSTDGQAVGCGISHTVCENYGRAQDPVKDAEHQLNDGIRYFDLRVCGSGSPIGSTFVTCHGLEAAPLEEIVDQTRAWVEGHPGEVVWLDFNHHYLLDVDSEAAVIEAAFALPDGGSMLIPPQSCSPGDVSSGICADTLTLQGIAAGQLGSVIVDFVNDGAPGDDHRQPIIDPAFYDRHPLFWGRTSSMPSAFGASPEVFTVLPRVIDSLRVRGNFDPRHFFVQFLQTTPDGGSIANAPLGSLLSMAFDSNPIIGPAIFTCGHPGDTCFAQFRPENLNVLAINFYNRTDYTVTRHTTMTAEQFDNCLQHDPRCPLETADQIATLRCALDGQFATCTYLDEVRFDFVEEILRLNAYARTPPVVEVSTAIAPTATDWYDAAALGGVGNTLRVDVSATDYRYETGISALDCLDDTTFHSLSPGTNAPFARGHLDLGDGVHVLDCRATDGAASGFHQAGNRGAGPNSTPAPVIYRVDTTPPEIHCSDTHLLLNQPAPLSATVTDATSGPAAASVSASVSTSQVGTFSASLTAADEAGNEATAVCPYTVSYGINLRYDVTKRWNSGSVVPIKVDLVDYFGLNVSNRSITVRATTVTRLRTGETLVPTSPGSTNPNFVFVVSPSKGYLYNLKTSGYPSGPYTLGFVAGGDPLVHEAPFLIR